MFNQKEMYKVSIEVLFDISKYRGSYNWKGVFVCNFCGAMMRHECEAAEEHFRDCPILVIREILQQKGISE